MELDFERSPFGYLFNRTTYRGHEGIRSLNRERYDEAWAAIADNLDEVIDAGIQVITVVTSRGAGGSVAPR